MFGTLEKLAGAGKSLVAARVGQSGVWRSEGDRTPAHFISKKTGDSVGASINAIETAEKMKDLPLTEQAYREGKLTGDLAVEVTSASVMSPVNEKHLLEVAINQGLGPLKKEAARVRAQAESDEADRALRLHRSRYLRSWHDSTGAFRMDARLTPEAGAQVMVALDVFRQECFNSSRRAGLKESGEALQADALVEMANLANTAMAKDGQGGPKATINIRVDHEALMRGHTLDGEICETDAGVPLTVGTVWSLSGDSLVNILAYDQETLQKVTSIGRTISKKLRLALIEMFQECVVEGCHETKGLEFEHVKPLAQGGLTCIENIVRMCRRDHRL